VCGDNAVKGNRQGLSNANGGDEIDPFALRAEPAVIRNF
jgi:hypothetical protein